MSRSEPPLEKMHASPGDPIALPTQVSFMGGVATVKTETWLPRRLRDVATIVKPKNWVKLGPFFESIKRGPPGEILESFVIDWNTFRAQHFEVHLKADYTADQNHARTDYSLIYDEDDEILVDEGWVEASRTDQKPRWTRYIAVKKLKFASSFLNLLAPGMAAMFLESKATDALLRAVDAARRKSRTRLQRPSRRRR